MALEDAKHAVDTAFARDERRGLSFENTFGGAPSFLRRRYTKSLDGVDIAVTGVPFDQAVTNRPGARFGPRAIREASALQSPDAPYGWGFSPLDELCIVDYGDVAFDYAKVSETPGAIAAHSSRIIDSGAAQVTLGGDHFITLPVLRAHADKLGPLSLIQFDAHSDSWVDDDMDRIDHGTFVYKAIKAGLIEPVRSVQIGIRTDNPDLCGMQVIDAPSVHAAGPAQTAAQIRDVVGTRRCYISFDIDALDPAFAPGTGTPVWGGLSTAQAAAILRALAGLDVIGGDVVEVSPPHDPSGITAVAGAHVAMELICLIAWRRLAKPSP